VDIRYSANQKDVKKYTTEELREEFLIEKLYVENEVVAIYSHVDRMLTLGCMPTTEKVSIDKGIDCWKNFGTNFLLERREIGVFNIGGKGKIEVDEETFNLDYKDCLYITKGTKTVNFTSEDPQNPAKFYMVSAPAHCAYKTTFISIKDAAQKNLGAMETSNKRTIYQFIHPDVLPTCQLLMGLTSLEPGSVWNSMPCHTHERRMEVYMYFEVPKDNIVMHFMGEPTQTKNIVMKNEEAVISPSWSIHCGSGTTNYSFIWAMGGENQAFDDMDTIIPTNLY